MIRKLEYMQIRQDIIKIQNKGLITIPKSFRDELGLTANSLARIIKIKGRLVLEPLKTLPYKVRSYRETEIDEFLELDEKGSRQLRKKGIL